MSIMSIKEIIERDLCVRCGACYGVCPKDAIAFDSSPEGDYAPVISNTKCAECNLCLDVCPKYKTSRIKKQKQRSFFLGNYISLYVGHSSDSTIRHIASSGGVVSSLLLYILEKKLASGAIVVGPISVDSVFSSIKVARTKEELLDAMGSKYVQVPLAGALKKLIAEKGNKKYVIVGLPCHLHAIRKAQDIFPQLKNKIFLMIGLFCAGAPPLEGTLRLLKKYGIQKGDIQKIIAYRGEGFPGSLQIQLKSGRIVRIPYYKYYPYLQYYIPLGCYKCSDHSAEYADISVGDIILKDLPRSREGYSLIVTRTPVGDKILFKSVLEGYITIHTQLEKEKVIASKLPILLVKKFNNLNDKNCETFEMYILSLIAFILSFIKRVGHRLATHNRISWLLPVYHNIIIRPSLILEAIITKILERKVVSIDSKLAQK